MNERYYLFKDDLRPAVVFLNNQYPNLGITTDAVRYAIGNDGFCVSLYRGLKIVVLACIRKVVYMCQYSCYEINFMSFHKDYTGRLQELITKCHDCVNRIYGDTGVSAKINILSYKLSGRQLLYEGNLASASCAKRLDIYGKLPGFKRAETLYDYGLINALKRKVNSGMYKIEPVSKNEWMTDYLSTDYLNFYRICYFAVSKYRSCMVLYDYISIIPVEFFIKYIIASGMTESVLLYSGNEFFTSPLLFFKKDDDIYSGKLDAPVFLPF